MLELHQWDIVEADVPYTEDKSKSKLRPVLVISETEVLVLKMTTHQHSDKPRPFEYEVMKWENAGLTAKTFIQCDKFIHLPQESFTNKYYGRLQMADIISVKAMMSYHGLTLKD